MTAQRAGKTTKKYRDKTCLRCGATYTPTTPGRRFCDSCGQIKQIHAPRVEPARSQSIRTQESVPCRRCGATPGQQCTTASGTISWRPHTERYDDVGRGPDPVRERQRAHNRKRNVARRAQERQLVFEHYGTACACCGATGNLTIDHINGGGRAHRDALGNHGGAVFYCWLIRNDFPGGYQTLCKSCNFSKGKGEYCRLHGEGVASRRQSALLSTRHWRAILATLSDAGSPEVLEAFAALSAQIEDITDRDTPRSQKSA